MAKKKEAKKKSITVRLGQLATPLSTSKVAEGTTVKDFIESLEMTFNASVRVNGKTCAGSYVLRNDDIVMIVGNVSGGA